MPKSDKHFDEMFPKAACRVTPEMSALGARAGLAKDWFLLWQADLLLRRCLSHRQKTNLFDNYSFWRMFNVFGEERAKMANRKRNPERREGERAEWRGFVDRRLDDDELAALDESKPKPSELFAAIDDIVQGGYRFMLSYNLRTKLVSVTIVDDNPDRKSGGYALSSSDEDAAGALKMAVYKHVVLLKSDWTPLLDAPPKLRRG